MKNRTPVSPEILFKGRPGDPRLGQWVNTEQPAAGSAHFVILGYPDDQGVRLNRGRPGAAGGPDGFRKHFYKLTQPADHPWQGRVVLEDWGNSVVTQDLTQTQAIAETNAAELAATGATGILLGGGHDFAAPSFKGLRTSHPKARWGLINIDPHLDTREREGIHLHSGNPFRELVESGKLDGRDLIQFGARRNRNSASSWSFCKERGVSILPLEDLRTGRGNVVQAFARAVAALSKRCRFFGVTIDLDSCSDAEGTSAAPVLGFSAWELCEFARIAGRARGVRYLELAEGAPALDPSERIGRIAAEIAYAFIESNSDRSVKNSKKRG